MHERTVGDRDRLEPLTGESRHKDPLRSNR
jgi:hypothetical protein